MVDDKGRKEEACIMSVILIIVVDYGIVVKEGVQGRKGGMIKKEAGE